MKTSSFLMVGLVLVGCGGGEAFIDEGDESFDAADGPLLGAAGKDAADRSCNVVLRSLKRTSATKCTASAGCSVVFEGVMELSAQAVSEGGVPGLLYKNQDSSTWTQVTAQASTATATAGFKRYIVKLERKTISPGLSATGLSRARIDVAPFVKLPSGARLFDKQRGQTDFQDYTLSQAFGWQVAEDASVCAPKGPPAQVDFSAAWQQTQRGALVAGGRGVITYALDRLPNCRGTHNGFPAWDVVAFVKFSPGGELVSGSVRGFDSPSSVPSNSSAKSVPFTFDLPKGATSAEVWFNNFTGAGSSCTEWDSNNGSNWRFTVEPKSFAAVQWVGNAGSSTTRACARAEGAPSSINLDSYLQQRACVWVESDVYVPGLTDGVGGLKPHAIFAEVETTLDGVRFVTEPLRFTERVGNDYRFHYEIPKSALFYVPAKWTRFEYTFRFSTDGRTWTRDVTRAVTRDATFCNAAWATCAP